jgi:hypothetical protein
MFFLFSLYFYELHSETLIFAEKRCEVSGSDASIRFSERFNVAVIIVTKTNAPVDSIIIDGALKTSATTKVKILLSQLHSRTFSEFSLENTAVILRVINQLLSFSHVAKHL